MVDDQDTGVNQAEGETAVTEPGDEQTPQVTESEASTTEDKGAEEEKPVPYSRFRQVNERAKEYEAKLKEIEGRLTEMDRRTTPQEKVDPQEQQVKQLLNQYGYLSRDEFQAELDKREQRIKEDQAVQQELTRLERKYDGKNGLPKFNRRKVVEFALEKRLADPEVAYKTLFEKEYLNWHVQQAANKSRGIKTETSDGSGAKPAGASNQDLLDAVKAGDDKAFDTMIRRSNVFSKFFGK